MHYLDDIFDEELGIGPKKKKKPAPKKKVVAKAKPKPKPKAKPKKAKRKERRKKILKGVGAIATGGVSLALSKKGPKPLKKIGKGLAAMATGGASLLIAKAKKKKAAKKAVVVAKKAIQVARTSTTPQASAQAFPLAQKAVAVARAAMEPDSDEQEDYQEEESFEEPKEEMYDENEEPEKEESYEEESEESYEEPNEDEGSDDESVELGFAAAKKKKKKRPGNYTRVKQNPRTRSEGIYPFKRSRKATQSKGRTFSDVPLYDPYMEAKMEKHYAIRRPAENNYEEPDEWDDREEGDEMGVEPFELGVSAKRKKRRKKILRGLGAVATGGVSLAIKPLAKKAIKVAKKAIKTAKSTQRPVAKAKAIVVAKKAVKIAKKVNNIPVVGKANLFKINVKKFASAPVPAPTAVKLAAVKLDILTTKSLKEAHAKPVSKRSKLKFNLFSKLKHLSAKLPVDSITRVNANKRILFECQKLGPYG